MNLSKISLCLMTVATSFIGAADTENHLLADWNFTHGQNQILPDGSGHGNNGTINSPEYIMFGNRKFLKFRRACGTTVEILYSEKLKIDKSFTIIAWFSLNPMQPGSWQHIIYKENDYALRELNGSIVFSIKNENKNIDFSFQHNALNDGLLHQAAISYDSTNKTLNLYWDGELKKSSKKMEIKVGNNSSPVLMGGDYYSFEGFIYNVKIYNTYLSKDEIVQDYRQNDDTKNIFDKNQKFEKDTVVIDFEKEVPAGWEIKPGSTLTEDKSEVISDKKSLKAENKSENPKIKWDETRKDNIFLQSGILTGKRIYQLEFDYKVLNAVDGTFYIELKAEPSYENIKSYYRNINPEAKEDVDWTKNFKMLRNINLPMTPPGKVLNKKILFEADQAAKRSIAFHLSGKGSVVIDNMKITEYKPIKQSPLEPCVICPVNKSTVSDFALDFSWLNAGDSIKYELQIDSSELFSNPSTQLVEDMGTDREYYKPDTILPQGKYYWRIRGINEYGQCGKWSPINTFTINAGHEKAQIRRKISDKSPLFIFQWNDGHPIAGTKSVWNEIPAELRKACSFYISNTQGIFDYAAAADYMEKQGIPFFMMNRLMFKTGYGGKMGFTPLSLQEYLYQTNKNYLGSFTCEQAVWNPEIADYNIAMNNLAAKYGNLAIHDDFGPTVILDLDKEWRKNQTEYQQHVIPVQKCVFYSCDGHSSVFGWWLSHKNSQWGIQPEAWYFHQSGYEKLNEPPLRHAGDIMKWSKEINGRPYEVLKSHPETMWGMFILTGMISGATVFPFELCEAKRGENLSFWFADGRPTRTWTRVVKPLLEDIVKYKLIPERREVEEKVKLAYVITDNDVPKTKVVGYLHTESGPLQKIMDVAYGKHYWCEFIPNTSRYYYVPIVFEEDAGNLPSGIRPVYSKDFKDAEALKKYFDQYYPAVDTGSAFVAQVGSVTAIMNTNENADYFEDYNVKMNNPDIKKVNGIVGVHQYIVIKELSNNEIFVHVNNRSERNSTIEFECIKKPELKIVPESAIVDSKWDEEKKIMTVTVNHKEGAVRLFLN